MDKLGNITLIHDDCMNVLRELPSKCFDLAIVDPPYGINITSSGRLGHYGNSPKRWDKTPPDSDYFNHLFRISKNQIVWGGNYFCLPPTRCFIIWDKLQPQSISFASCEYAYTSFDLSAKTFYLRPQNADISRIHPTQKPVALYKWLLQHYAKPNDKILDTHLGSGSIAIACHDLGFELTGIELDDYYYEAARKRIQTHQLQMMLNFTE